MSTASFEQTRTPQSSATRDKRSAVRLTVRIKGATGRNFEAWLLNISTSGVLLETDADAGLAIGENILLDLAEDGTRAARIVWSCGSHHGCRFARPLSKAAVSAALLRGEAFDRKAVTDAATIPPREPAAKTSFGKELAIARKRRRMTQTELANAARVSKTTVCKWEKGHAKPRREALALLQAMFGDLMHGTEKDSLRAEPAPSDDASNFQASNPVWQCKQALAARLGVPASSIAVTISL